MGNGKRNVVCLKWGTLYSHEHVNRLHRGARRNLAGPFSFICFTDDPEGIEAGVEVRSLDDLGIGKIPIPSIWTKLALPHPEAGLEGTCLFIDLDVVIWGRIDEFFEFPGEFCIIHNWIERRKSCSGNACASATRASTASKQMPIPIWSRSTRSIPNVHSGTS